MDRNIKFDELEKNVFNEFKALLAEKSIFQKYTIPNYVTELHTDGNLIKENFIA